MSYKIGMTRARLGLRALAALALGTAGCTGPMRVEPYPDDPNHVEIGQRPPCGGETSAEPEATSEAGPETAPATPPATVESASRKSPRRVVLIAAE